MRVLRLLGVDLCCVGLSDPAFFSGGFRVWLGHGIVPSRRSNEGRWTHGRPVSEIPFAVSDQEVVQCANVANGLYHRYKDDIQLMVKTGLHTFRF
uniref:Uncharacterized protein n=1 Tax=Hyaloperonospora arabidopsidis (strain Emoy2) TaxID=559515 RepID=M4B507_HYAAE